MSNPSDYHETKRFIAARERALYHIQNDNDGAETAEKAESLSLRTWNNIAQCMVPDQINYKAIGWFLVHGTDYAGEHFDGLIDVYTTEQLEYSDD